MITVKHKGDFSHMEKFFNRAIRRDYLNSLSIYAKQGVEALKAATPKSSGKTAEAWDYLIENDGSGKTTISFINNNENQGINIAILLIYGHGTMDGSYVEGIDFVTPAIRPIFQSIADQMWKEATK